jgi:DNA-binding LacI/PurR family transcriptional regulator
MGYQPNPMGTGLAQFKRSSNIKPIQAALAWLNFWPDPKHLRSFAEFDRYWQGANAAAERLGYRLEEIVCSSSVSYSRLTDILLARGIHGILLPPGVMTTELKGFKWEHFSSVRLRRPDTEFPFNGVMSAQADNAMLAFDSAREKGYARVGFVGIAGQDRRFGEGYLWAQTGLPANLRLPPQFIEEQAPRSEQQKTVEAWLKKTKPDAIITDWPELTHRLEKAGCRVPEDIGLASLNVLDTPIDAGIYPNPEEIGRVAILVLISLINDNDRGFPAIPREILIRGSWVNGMSLPQR